jgi:AGZA family xanthine/uracil permease-like MFS transporter
MAGVTTFLTMCYIVFVNPAILEQAGMDYQSVMIATCLAAAVGTIIMGLYANYPFAMAPGMGLNAFFVFTIVLTMGYSWQQALAIVFISGVLFILLTITGLRTAIVNALPLTIKHAIPAGIGLFIAFIGLNNAGIIRVNQGPILDIISGFEGGNIQDAIPEILQAPPQVLQMGSMTDAGVLLAIAGFIILSIFMLLKVRTAMLLTIVIVTVAGIPLGITQIPDNISFRGISMAPTFMKLDFQGLFNQGEHTGVGGLIFTFLMVVISFTLVDLFDTMGTLLGTAAKGNMLDKDGNLPRINKALLADATATTAGALMGTSTVTTYIESGSGIIAGGRTGLTAIVTGILFVLAIFLAPIAGMIPAAATSPILIMVGVLMLDSLRKIDFDNFEEMIPALMVVIIMPFTYSIANGIAWGIVLYTLIKLVKGKASQLHPIMYVLSVLFILRYLLT